MRSCSPAALVWPSPSRELLPQLGRLPAASDSHDERHGWRERELRAAVQRDELLSVELE